VFYPEGLPQRSELEYAARHFSAIEINGTFYSLQRPDSREPADAVKVSKVTYHHPLDPPERRISSRSPQSLARFMEALLQCP